MQSQRQISAVDGSDSPLQIAARWPLDRPLMMLHSGRVDARWARWSVLASPIVRYQFGTDRRSRWIGSPPKLLNSIAFTHDPLADVDAVLAATRLKENAGASSPAKGLPFHGGWIGYFSYDLGRLIEPRAQVPRGARDDRGWPLIDLAWCPNAMIFDHALQQWFTVGDPPSLNPIEQPIFDAADEAPIGSLRSNMRQAEYEEMVQRVIEAIAAGDIYQANVAQRFSAELFGSPRALCCAAFEVSQPWYGVYLELPGDRAVISLSPELFLRVDPITRQVITRPIKGTRPSSVGQHDLHASAKDAAELHMIVDLMRNDLGRVCELGSVRVDEARVIETHPTVHHGVAEVTGALRDATTLGDLLRATFPGGSITGAPKIRAMQIIDELEPVRRGPYCGAIGMISNCGAVQLNIAIRTLCVHGNQIDYWAGAGIVADSKPGQEYLETLDKTAVLQQLVTPHCVAET